MLQDLVAQVEKFHRNLGQVRTSPLQFSHFGESFGHSHLIFLSFWVSEFKIDRLRFQLSEILTG